MVRRYEFNVDVVNKILFRFIFTTSKEVFFSPSVWGSVKKVVAAAASTNER